MVEYYIYFFNSNGGYFFEKVRNLWATMDSKRRRISCMKDKNVIFYIFFDSKTLIKS